MSGWCRLSSLILLGVLVAEVQAQLPVPPPPPVAVPVLVPTGIGFSYRSGHLRVGGFLSNGFTVGTLVPGGVVYGAQPLYGPVPYYLPLNSSISYRYSVNYITPNVVLGANPPLTSAYDLSGVDLDVVPANKLMVQGGQDAAPGQPPGNRNQARAEPPRLPQRGEEIPAPAKAAVARQGPPPPAPAPPARAKPNMEAERFLDLGLAAFGQKEYGVAAQRFRQAAETDPKTGRPCFYLAQAYLALGKYQEAVTAIEQGFQRNPAWPRGTFHPKLDLYRGIEEEFRNHCRLLETTLKRQPENATYLLLLAYQRWFDGDRDTALALLRRARVQPNHSAVIDAFLKVAAEPVAVK